MTAAQPPLVCCDDSQLFEGIWVNAFRVGAGDLWGFARAGSLVTWRANESCEGSQQSKSLRQ